MKLLIVLLVISLTYSYSLTTDHPNSLKKVIDYEQNGLNWSGNCKSGAKQSPIAIDKYDKVPKSVIKIDYEKDEGKVQFNGSFYRIDTTKNGCKIDYTDINTRKTHEFTLKRVIFKTPAEHKIEGTLYDMEIQLVHTTKAKIHNNLLIVSIMAKATLKTAEVDDLFKDIDFYGHKKSHLSHSLKKAIEDAGEYFVYEGSQTVPNCVENVTWVVFRKPIKVGMHELNAAQRLFCKDCMPKGNTRKIQKQGARKVYQFKLDH